jgi:hypothetical protein
MNRFLYVVCVIDEFLCHMAESVVVFLEEWLSVSQRQIEWSLIGAYICIGAFGNYHGRFYVFMLTIHLAANTIAGYCMALTGRLRQTTLFYHRYEVSSRLVRMATTSAMALIIPLQFIRPIHWGIDIANATAAAVFIAFFFVIAVVRTGRRGRRRKLALAKLKSLFGGIQIPQPEGI